MLQQGQTLAGYRIEEIAGVGGMGVVYRATQLSLERPVALKVLSSTLVGNRSFRERFRREGRHAAALEHPNIIPVYEAGESNGLMFIAMRLVDGPTLADLMHKQAVSGRETLRIIGAIASALDAAHDAGLVHRDVKPQNILLTSGGHPYLADFGITKGSAAGGLTRTGDFVGSLSYVAPEQMDGADVGPASDIYALAAVLFQCLTGALPYERETDAALMHAHLFAPPPTVSELDPDVPAELDAVFARGMAKSPAGRYETAGAMVAAAAAALEDLPAPVLDKAPAFASAERRSELEAEQAAAASPDPAQASEARLAAAALVAPAGLTAADRQRDGGLASADAPAPKRSPAPASRRGGRWALILAAALVLLAPVAGYALGGGGGSDQPGPKEQGTGPVRLTAGDGWNPGQSSVPGLKLTDPVSIQSSSGVVLTAGRVAQPAAGLDPSGAAFRSALPGVKPTAVTIADRTGLRYAGKQAAGGSVWAVFFPDERGWTVVDCRSAAPDAPLEKQCAQVAATIRTPGVRPAAWAPDKALAAALTAGVTALNKTRAQTKEGLRAKRPSVRAAAATRTATAERQIAGKLAAIDARPQDARLVTPLIAALRAQAQAFDRLAAAASAKERAANGRAPYRRARDRVAQAERDLTLKLAALSRGGYRAGAT